MRFGKLSVAFTQQTETSLDYCCRFIRYPYDVVRRARYDAIFDKALAAFVTDRAS